MTLCRLIEIITPKKYVLNGLWFGSLQAKKAIICLHGLGSNMFSNHAFLLPLVQDDTAVLVFNNRGHDDIASIKKIDQRKKRGFVKIEAGAAKEVFVECADDIQGAIKTAKAQGAQQVFLLGHSTGCQKSVYYMSKKHTQSDIAGVILLSPMSDYAGAKHLTPPNELDVATRTAQQYVKNGKPHDLLPSSVWPEVVDAQRFLSLYTPKSDEEVFSYAHPEDVPHSLHRLKVPTLVVLAEKDEYRDRSIKKIATWFATHLHISKAKVEIISRANHSFFGNESDVVTRIQSWMRFIPFPLDSKNRNNTSKKNA
ncbi:MAG: alpha/beta fold hydrolase [Candidatus Pacebacteria bacterium]|nr:alpha/beta fold hydrolase [Candidatus Paceibacterota bacterium]